jgi:phosphoribosylformylglycinamidine synthase
VLLPHRIMQGVIDGVKVGGNCSGIPTPQGFLYFDERYKGKPLVFVGTVGLLPRMVNKKPGFEKKALPGDAIVMVGGRVGMDGIHGATFSSEAMTANSPATAVQIGDPITQKKMSDAIVKEARDLGLYNSITDNGAGGLSCSVAEMAKESNGCRVELDAVPLKYPNLEPWKTWVSESQERMTLAVPKEKVKAFVGLMQKRGVEATVIGEFTNSGKCEVFFKKQTVMDIPLDFLHEGLPKKQLKRITL